MKSSVNRKVYCFGEVLWDLFPSGKVAGGAPFNVAFRLNAQNIESYLVSAVGKDDLGKELTHFIQSKHISTQYLVQNDSPTGVVRVEVFKDGEVNYTIEEDVSWDYIKIPNPLKSNDILVYGSLAARSIDSKRMMLELLTTTGIYPVFDVNLRFPFYDNSLIIELIEFAKLLKVNMEEFSILVNWHELDSLNFDEQVHILFQKYSNLELLCITNGAYGATVFKRSENKIESIFQPGIKIDMVDPVGSGDAFLATLIGEHLVHGKDLALSLQHANEVGAYVATQIGAIQ